MLVMRAAQLEAFTAAFRQQQAKRIAEELSRRFAPFCAALGADALARTARLGVERAAEHGLELDGDRRDFVELMLLLGSDFDRDPLLPFAREAFADTQAHPQAKVRRARFAADDYLADVAGPGGRATIAALRRIAAYSWREWRPRAAETFDVAAERTLRELYPERLDAIAPDTRAGALLTVGRSAAEAYDLHAAWEQMLFVLLRFMLGSGFDHDPQFPWAAGALACEQSDARGEQLRIGARAFLGRLTAALPGNAG